MKEYFWFCNNCYHVEHIAVPNHTFVNIMMRCNCGYTMGKTIKT